jgi:hypothetical protein
MFWVISVYFTKEHSPEVLSIPPGAPCVLLLCFPWTNQLKFTRLFSVIWTSYTLTILLFQIIKVDKNPPKLQSSTDPHKRKWVFKLNRRNKIIEILWRICIHQLNLKETTIGAASGTFTVNDNMNCHRVNAVIFMKHSYRTHLLSLNCSLQSRRHHCHKTANGTVTLQSSVSSVTHIQKLIHLQHQTDETQKKLERQKMGKIDHMEQGMLPSGVLLT